MDIHFDPSYSLWLFRKCLSLSRTSFGALTSLRSSVEPFLKTMAKDAPHTESLKELDQAIQLFEADMDAFQRAAAETLRGGAGLCHA
jgi:hypothetical protein